MSEFKDILKSAAIMWGCGLWVILAAIIFEYNITVSFIMLGLALIFAFVYLPKQNAKKPWYYSYEETKEILAKEEMPHTAMLFEKWPDRWFAEHPMKNKVLSDKQRDDITGMMFMDFMKTVLPYQLVDGIKNKKLAKSIAFWFSIAVVKRYGHQ